jgi:hypothetical protein
MRKYIIIVILLVSFSSCIQGSFKGLYSYYSKTQKTGPKLFLKTSNSDTICNKANNADEKIIIINGIDLKKCLSNYKKNVVYIWGPNCHSDVCIPLQVIQKKCSEKGYNLFVVAEYYDYEKMQYHYDLNNNIYGVDVEYYKTNLTKNYIDLFLKDVDPKLIYSNMPNKFLEFENEKFIESFENINQLKI